MGLAVLHSWSLQLRTASGRAMLVSVQQRDLPYTQRRLCEGWHPCSGWRCAAQLVYFWKRDPGFCSSGRPAGAFEKVQKQRHVPHEGTNKAQCEMATVPFLSVRVPIVFASILLRVQPKELGDRLWNPRRAACHHPCSALDLQAGAAAGPLITHQPFGCCCLTWAVAAAFFYWLVPHCKA